MGWGRRWVESGIREWDGQVRLGSQSSDCVAGVRGRAVICSLHVPATGSGSAGSSCAQPRPTEPATVAGMRRELVASALGPGPMPHLVCTVLAHRVAAQGGPDER